ncbi:hypothetical protein HGRIS_005599 [Hohenbuehelia grisea]|uniref:Non-haem dioxygenase N-terminal domain-containing protein n=1 Tax=Hohenbuehelia grisea TaxID=104357 RepID=A0ABR3JYA7_9AGAR
MSLLDEYDTAAQAFKDIPIIDLTNATSNDAALRRALAEDIRKASIEVGFFYIKNHGIPDETIDSVVSNLQEFFALSLESKMKIDCKTTPNFKGYSPLLSGNNDPNNAGDLQEGFEFGWEELQSKEDSVHSEDGAMAGANVWPSELPSFRIAALRYYHAAVQLGKLLFPLFAQALNLPEDFFEDKTRNSAALMKLLHYPPQTGEIDPRVIGIGAHTE